MDIIGTGLSGLVGSRIVSLFPPTYTFANLSRETDVDLLDFQKVKKMITASRAPWVFHFAAFTDVQGAEGEKEKGEESISWKVNVLATENIVSVCRDTGKRLLYISTDYVFDGTKHEYQEDDIPHPISWYGRTKYEGEKRVEILKEQSLIVRIANPYKSNPMGKMDFVHKMRDKMEKGIELKASSDQIFCPTFVDDLAESLRFLIHNNSSGIYHVVAHDGITPYKAAHVIAEIYHLKNARITSTSYNKYFLGKALPPKQALLKHDKINASGIKLHTFEEGVLEVVKQERNG